MQDDSPFFIVNPAADTGRLKKKWAKHEEKFRQLVPDMQVVFTEYPTHGTKLTKMAADMGYHKLYTVGGDGVTNEAVQGIMRDNLDLTLGPLPGGTSNDFHFAHGIPADPVEAFEALQNGTVIQSELGKIDGDFGGPYYFLIHADCGVSAIANKMALEGTRLLKGEFKYTIYAIKAILSLKSNPGVLKIDDRVWEENFNMIAVGMTGSMSGFKLWPGNYPQRGDFGINFFYGQNRRQMLGLLLKAEKGTHLEEEGVEYERGKKIDINLERPWCYEAEGEMFTTGSQHISMEMIPDALKVMMPHTDFKPKD
ncbi:MAG: hypothetical protein INQ03_19430 [Candidatus Heimdallarchaeota archaeon]|nr:hypothetical protein [Candidatus Heimdallarchaeota archaeon]